MPFRTACLLLMACAWMTPGLGRPVETIDLRVKSARTVSPCGHVSMFGSAFRDSKTEVPVEVSLLELAEHVANTIVLGAGTNDVDRVSGWLRARP